MPAPKRSRTKSPGRRDGPRKSIPLNFPQTMCVRMKYHEQEGLNPGTAGALSYLTYSANGAYDCNVGGTGHSASSFDTWIGATGGTKPYGRYVVLGSRIRCIFVSSSATQNNQIGIIQSSQATLPASVTAVAEDRRNKSQMLGPTGSGRGIVTMTSKWSARQWYHNRAIMSDDALHGGINTNPSEQAYFHVWASGFGADTDSFPVQVEIEYIVVCFDPNDLATS